MDLKKLFSSEFKNPEIPKKLFGASAIIALFFLAFKAPLDPDLFWHLKTGELMWQYKIIPKIDWYSYTMSGFEWIDHEWLAEILMFKIKDIFGWPGLAIFFAIIIVFIFAWLMPRISKSLETKKYPFYTSLLLGMLGALASSLIFGARPQVFSLLGTALIFYIIRQYQLDNKSKIIYALPALFLLWANMHASFILGLALLGFFLVLDRSVSAPAQKHPDAEWVKMYRPLPFESRKKLGRIALFSAAVTFINPYGLKIYEEIFRTFSDDYGRSIIIEWLSPNFHNAEAMIFGFYLILVFIIASVTKKIDLFSFVLLPFVLFLALQSSRNIPTFVIASLPFLIRSVEGFEKVFAAVMQKKLIAFSFCALLIAYPPYIYETKDAVKTMHSEQELAESGKFPGKEALSFLENYRTKNPGNMLNDYFWGGYLIGNVKCSPFAEAPEDKQIPNAKEKELDCKPKVFIDGRMAHWKTPERHILKDYIEMIDLKENFRDLTDKYQIKIIFSNKDTLLGYSLIFNNEWKKIYEDDLAVIYEKK